MHCINDCLFPPTHTNFNHHPMRTLYTLALLLLAPMAYGQGTQTKISAEELQLYNMLMDYRASKGLAPIPLSNALTLVARTHCRDLAINQPDLNANCNSHSWSSQGNWTSCCYTRDHRQASCMWNKPRELTSYTGDGFEIAVGSSDPKYNGYTMTARYAMDSWKGSFHHNNVIINEDMWKNTQWNAIGVGIYQGFATVWFGKEVDAEGAPERE